jgi:hypothetical protein
MQRPFWPPRRHRLRARGATIPRNRRAFEPRANRRAH